MRSRIDNKFNYKLERQNKVLAFGWKKRVCFPEFQLTHFYILQESFLLVRL